jgi:Ca2+-binding RTX toxin-like protein
MPTTFNWIFLGNSTTVLDPTEGNFNAENANLLVTQTFGSATNPLYDRITQATMINIGGNATALDQDNTASNDQFSTDIGAGVQTFTFDASVIYNATVTYANGTTGNVTAVIAQDTAGNLFLAPEPFAAPAPDTAVYEALPIVSITLNGLFNNTNAYLGLGIDRTVTGWDNGWVDGTGGDDLINAGYVEPIGNGTDRIDNNDGITATSLNDDRIRAGAGNDTVLAGLGNDSVLGGTGNDSLSGEAGTDTLLGEDGNDTLLGGDGTDSLDGGANDDRLFGGNGNDTLLGGAGNDSLDGGANDDQLFGGAGTDTLLGAGGADTLDGGEGADSLDGGAGNDSLLGGTGVFADTLSGGTGDDTLRGGDGNDSLLGGDGIDQLFGDAGDDTLDGGNGADQIEGGDGNDALRGGTGTFNDSLFGGAGNDTLFGDAGADVLNGGQGMDFVDYSASGAGVTVDLAAGTGAGGDAAGDTLTGVDGLFGSAFDDVLLGFDGFSTAPSDPYTNIFYGGLGNDYLDGRDGDDILYGGADNDTILGGGGADLVDGGTGNDLLFGGDGADTLLGGAGNDTLGGGAGADLLDGGDDQDQFTATGTADDFGDTVQGGNGGDDFDTLDLSAWGKALTNVYRDPMNPENGYVEFLDSLGAVIGTITFSDIETVIPCFTPGTLILTARGEVPVERLAVGDLVQTRDGGTQCIRWVGRKDLGLADLVMAPALWPVLIPAGALGPGLPARDMRVSPQHRVLVEGARAEMLFGEPEVLVAAVHLVGHNGIRRDLTPGTSYIHIMFDAHEIVCSDGLWSESFQPSARIVGGMDADRQEEIRALFPELSAAIVAFPSARLTLKAHEARVLLAA